MDTLREKLNAYQSALIVRFALIEAASLFGIVCYLRTRNILFLIISGFVIIYFATLKPTKVKVENDLALSYEESLEFNYVD